MLSHSTARRPSPPLPSSQTGWRLMMQMKDSLVRAVLLTCALCFPSHTHAGDASVQYGSHQLRAVEKKLRGYLTSRVLVFRKGEISRHQIAFDSRGHLSAESGSELRSRPNAILFIDLTLDPEHLVILGRAVRMRISWRVQSRYPPGEEGRWSDVRFHIGAETPT